MTRYKHIHFVPVKGKPRQAVYSCRTNKSQREIGQVRYSVNLGGYCFIPSAQVVMPVEVMENIIDFIKKISPQEGEK